MAAMERSIATATTEEAENEEDDCGPQMIQKLEVTIFFKFSLIIKIFSHRVME